MTKNSCIITFIFVGIVATSALSQDIAQATMRVSVEVVSGSTVEVYQPSIISLSSSKKSALGMLSLDGVENSNVLISNSAEVKMINQYGDEVMMAVSRNKEKRTDNSDNILYEGIAKSKQINSFYRGELTTTIEYL